MSSCWTVGPATTPGMDVKFTLWSKRVVDPHQAVVQACAAIAREHALRQQLEALEAKLGQMRADRFATECLMEF